MKATEVLMEEHRVIERVLTAIERASQSLSRDDATRPGIFIEAADFVSGFADGCHHKKEENVLFPAMVEGGLSYQFGPVSVMLAEHDEGRTLNNGMLLAAQRLQAGDKDAKDQVIHNAMGYVTLMRQHIAKEDHVLFPMADQIIPKQEHQKIYEAFNHIEHDEAGEGIHEKYLALAERLEKESFG
ncbi:MAG: hemerythrin domain-containing protein [Anaerolineales bacterium]|nr:hemerythrin domain-containing protein [Anaerolineales bacterium]